MASAAPAADLVRPIRRFGLTAYVREVRSPGVFRRPAIVTIILTLAVYIGLGLAALALSVFDFI